MLALSSQLDRADAKGQNGGCLARGHLKVPVSHTGKRSDPKRSVMQTQADGKLAGGSVSRTLPTSPEEERGSARGLSHERPGSLAKASDKVRTDTRASQVRMAPVSLEAGSPPSPPSHPKPDPDPGLS